MADLTDDERTAVALVLAAADRLGEAGWANDAEWVSREQAAVERACVVALLRAQRDIWGEVNSALAGGFGEAFDATQTGFLAACNRLRELGET